MPDHALRVVAGMNGPEVHCAGCARGPLWEPHLLALDSSLDGWMAYPFCGDLLARHRAARS